MGWTRVFSRRRRDRERAEDLATHLDMLVESYRGMGMSETDARRQARLAFGNPRAKQEELDHLNRLPVWDTLARDVRHACRRLRRSRGFAVSAILTLAIGIGACTAMFSVVRAVLLRPFGVTAPGRVVVLWPEANGTPGEFAFNAARRLQDGVRAFDEVALVASVNSDSNVVIRGAEPFHVSGSLVSAAFFDVLGARPLVGRTLRSIDEQPTAAPVIVLGYALWQRRFGGDPHVLGRQITVDSDTCEVVGVMPREFFFPNGAEYWMPAAPILAKGALRFKMPLDQMFETVGVFRAVARLSRGSDIDRVLSQRASYFDGESRRLGMDFSSLRFGVVPLADYIVGPPRQALVLLMAAVGVVLLLACANVAGLLLARGAARTHEIALRAALGATRGAIAREQLVESAVLACAGAALGVALAAAGLRTMIAWSPVDIPRLDATRLDWTVLGFAVLITLMAVAVVGFFPAWQARRLSFSDNLRGPSSGSTSSAAQARTRSALVSFEVGVTLVLVMAAALCVQSFIHLSRVDLGFDPAHVLTFSIRGLGRTRFPTRAQQNEAVENVLASIERVPQVTAAGGVFLRPFELGPVGMDTGFVREGQPDTLDTQVRNPGLAWEAVTPGYFRSMGIRLVHGRNFGPDDTDRSPLVVIVSEAMAARVWPGQDPIGKRLRAYGAGDTTPPRWQTVIGVVATARYREIDTPRLDLYVPLRQSPDNIRFFTVRTGIHPERLLPTLRSELARLDPAFTIDELATMAQIVAKAQGPWRFDMLIFGLFGVAALGFTVIGLFGLIAYLASQRRREIAVRVALGATRSNIVGIVVLHGLRPMLAGLSLGIPCVWLATRLLSRLLYGVGALDVGTFVISVVILLAAGAFAGYLPARGAARMDPAIVLRSE